MEPGKLDRRITLLERAEQLDASTGQDVGEWSPKAKNANVWAQVLPITGRESFAASQIYAEVDTQFVVRYRSDVSVEDRVLYDGRTFDIVAVLEIGRREGLRILGTARAEA